MPNSEQLPLGKLALALAGVTLSAGITVGVVLALVFVGTESRPDPAAGPLFEVMRQFAAATVKADRARDLSDRIPVIAGIPEGGILGGEEAFTLTPGNPEEGDAESALAELAALNADFQTAAELARRLFDQRTQTAVSAILDSEAEWWADAEKLSAALDAMGAELRD